MKLAILLATTCALSLSLAAQNKTNAGEAKAPVGVQGISVGLPFYTVDDAFRLKIRDLEHASDQLQKENLAMKVRIKENEAKDAAIWDEIAKASSKYAEEKKIDPARYDFDAEQVKFPQKKKP